MRSHPPGHRRAPGADVRRVLACRQRIPERGYGFGPFELRGSEQVLMRLGIVVPVPPKVLATLLVLVEAQGKVVRKTEPLDRVWPGHLRLERALQQATQIGDKEVVDEATKAIAGLRS